MRTETNKSKQTPHETTESEKMQHTAEINPAKSEQQNRAWSTMKWFAGVAKSEAEFYARFQELPDEDATFLKSFYNITEDWDLFRMICKFWNVRISHRMEHPEYSI
jgi:hypothetical protein